MSESLDIEDRLTNTIKYQTIIYFKIVNATKNKQTINIEFRRHSIYKFVSNVEEIKAM